MMDFSKDSSTFLETCSISSVVVVAETSLMSAADQETQTSVKSRTKLQRLDYGTRNAYQGKSWEKKTLFQTTFYEKKTELMSVREICL